VPPEEPAGVAVSIAKRAFDLAFAVMLLPVIAPAIAVLALAIWVESGAPILFKQRRTGLGGKSFVIFKLRSMHVVEDGPGLRHATRGDARVTRVGALMRKSSLDELPQIFNVLRGDMSLVGPRPHALGHDRHYSAYLPNYKHRFRARPGLTGLAQVEGLRGEIRDLEAMSKRVASDMAYVERWSFWLDLKILARTLPLVLRGSNAY
jgi:putative colanic acid biosynthesis UDP-glucose lipid carrier transferase